MLSQRKNHSRSPLCIVFLWRGQEADLAKIKARMEEMEAEAAKLKMMQEKQKEALDAGAFRPTLSAARMSCRVSQFARMPMMCSCHGPTDGAVCNGAGATFPPRPDSPACPHTSRPLDCAPMRITHSLARSLTRVLCSLG